MTIRDGMSAKLKRITSAFQKMERAARSADKATQAVNPGRTLENSASLIDRARKRLDAFINRQRDAGKGAEEVSDAWSRTEGLIRKALAVFSVAAVKGQIQKALEEFSNQYNAEVQLGVVMKNAGMDQKAFDAIRDRASELESKTILLWNQPPTTPSSITYGTPQAGQKLTLSTGGSTDPEGDAISYVWERKVDSGVWTQIGITTAKTIQDTVPSSGTTYYARVKAADAVGNESAYCTGSGKAISYNTPPVISGSDQNMGAKTDPFTYKYTVTDAQSATQTMTVTETLTNGAETITLRTYTATAGAQNTADLSSVWIRLIAGTHVLKITASDGAGGTAVRNITFSRTVTRIAAARAFNTDAKVAKVFVSLYPSDRPAGSTLHLEVTNNPFDTNPVWEDITEKANRLVHTFANSTVANGYGLGYRFYLLKGTEEIEITQATIRFA